MTCSFVRVLVPEQSQAFAVFAFLAGELADVAVVVAYGCLLSPVFLDIPRLGGINLHASLLPAYRGAAPIAWSLVRGETETGVTVFWIDEGMDTGPILVQRAVPIGPDEDAARGADSDPSTGCGYRIPR